MPATCAGVHCPVQWCSAASHSGTLFMRGLVAHHEGDAARSMRPGKPTTLFCRPCKGSSPQAGVSGMHSGARTAYACTRCYPQKNSSPWPDDGVFLSGWALGVPPVPLQAGTQAGHRPRRSGRGEDGAYGSQNRRVERHPHRRAGSVRWQILAQYGGRRPTAPLARELGRYAVAGGLASLVDVGVLVGLTSSAGGVLSACGGHRL